MAQAGLCPAQQDYGLTEWAFPWLCNFMREHRLWATLHPFFEGGGIMGRSVANEGFITALIRNAPYDGFHFFLAGEGQVQTVTEKLAALFPEKTRAGVFRVTTRHALPEAVAENSYEVFHLSDCVADNAALQRLRNGLSRNIFAVTGTTHSLSYARYPSYFLEQIWPGTTERDAIIATSTAGAAAMRAMFASLREGYSLPDSFLAPKIAHIPLGVDIDDFASPEEKPALRATVRQRLGIAPDSCMLLVFARVSHYSKMDILPLFRALVRAEAMGLAKGSYTLVLAGWMDSGDAAAAAYTDIAARLGVTFLLVPSPDNAVRKELFAAADIFLSPVDNPQETFGLTMLEAGAASLPVIASDFDGYRDLVTHGETGFLAPTLGPADTTETDILSGVWFDNQHHLQLAQQSVVSVPHLADCIARLTQDAALRERFGNAARERVLTRYTWDGVAKAHVALWDELTAMPLSAPVTGPPASHPARPAYGTVFGGYYTKLLDSGMRVRWTQFGEAVYRGLDFPAVYAGVERLVPREELRKMLFSARKPVAVSAFLPEKTPSPEGERAAFLVLWALKHDLLEESP
ncbi:MAG: D-inositol-3-phosphate glycosyltransferase [Desulfovibrio sp.]